MFRFVFAQASATDIPWPLISSVAAAVVIFGMLMFVAKRYKRCPSNRVLVIFGKNVRRQCRQVRAWWCRVRGSADPGLRLPQPGTDSD